MLTLQSIKWVVAACALASATAFSATYNDPITQDDLNALPRPFRSLAVGSTFSAESNFYGQEELYTDYKRDIMHGLILGAVTRITAQNPTAENNIIIEIGSGSAYATVELLQYMHITAPLNGVSLVAIDDFRPRTGEIGLRGGTIDIPERIAFDGTTSGTQYTGGDAYKQFLSNLVHGEATEVTTIGTLLNKLIIPRKTSDFISSYTRTDLDLMTTAAATDFYSITPDGTINPLDEIMASPEVSASNTSGRASVIILDIDPATGDDMYKTLRCAWNTLSDFGTLIIDDVSWQNTSATDPEDRPVQDGLESFLSTWALDINAGSSPPGEDYFSSDAHVRIYTYDGSDMLNPTIVDGPSMALTSDNQPVLEFHNIWPGRGRWIAVLRRDGTNSFDIADISAPITIN